MASLTTARRSNFIVKLALFIPTLSFLIAGPCLAQSQVASITVKSSWGGLGEPKSSELVIRQKNGHFYAGSDRVSDQLIQSFLTAVESKPRQESEFEVLGLGDDWLRANAAVALHNYLPKWQLRQTSPAQRELFRNTFLNPGLVSAALSSQESWMIMDDYPGILVQINKQNGDQYSLQSVGNSGFIGAWLVTAPSSEYGTSNVAISFDLRLMLPAKFTNRERLSERALRYMIADAIKAQIEEKWNALGAEAKLGSAIRPVTERFALVSSAIQILESIDLQGGESWNGVVRDPKLPPNVKIGFSFPIRKKKLIGVDSFLRRIDQYEQLAMSPDWLHQFLVTHPDAIYEIRFVEDRSFSHYAEQRLVEDLKSLGKVDLGRRVSASGADVVFLEVKNKEWSRWVVFPNGEMLLWQYQGVTVGNWGDKDFQFSECYGWKCVGAIISPNGSIDN